jgi:RHS repeat-associated protein
MKDRQEATMETTSRSVGRRWTRVLCLALAGLIAPGARPADAQVVRYHHVDAVGSVRAMTGQGGAVLERHDYLPFGEECLSGPCAGNPAGGQPRKFTGKERDPETGLDYFGARYYGSRIARFTAVDPVLNVQGSLVDPQQWNRYAYSLNNPHRYTDPDGRTPTIVTAAIGAGIGFVFAYGGSVASQAIRNGGFSGIDYDAAAIAGVGGAVSGAVAGLTLGLSVVAQAGVAGVVAVGAGSNIIGGAVAREVDADPQTRAISREIVFDGVSGAVGGAIGAKVGSAVGRQVPQLEKTAAGMTKAARAGSSNAGRARHGVRQKIEDTRRNAEIVATVAGSKTTDFAAPVVRTAAEEQRKEE